MNQKRLKTAGLAYMSMPGLINGAHIEQFKNFGADHIVSVAFHYFKIPAKMARHIKQAGKSRNSFIKMICYLLLRRYTKLTLAQVAKIFYTDHSTVSKGVKAVLKDERLRTHVANIELLILNKNK